MSQVRSAPPRLDGRAADALRPLTIETQVNRYAEGSALISCGHTRVLCTASVDEKLPPWLAAQHRAGVPVGGWLTAEYAMLPRSTHTRTNRGGGGREKEIQRLVGRSLRAAINLEA